MSLLWPRQMSVQTGVRYLDTTPWAAEEMFRSGQIIEWKQGKAWAMDRLELDRHVERRPRRSHGSRRTTASIRGDR